MRPSGPGEIHAKRVGQVNWVIARVRKQIELTAAELERILRQRSLQAGAVVTGEGVVEASGVGLHPGEQVLIFARLAIGRWHPERLILRCCLTNSPGRWSSPAHQLEEQTCW